MKYVIFAVLFSLNFTLKAQEENYFLQLGPTANAYKGDLQDSYENWGSSFHLGLKLNKKKRLNGAFLLSMGSVTGQSLNPNFSISENTSIEPNRFFRSTIITGQYDLQVNLIKNARWIVFLSQGIGLIRYNPKDDQGNRLLEMSNTRASNEDYSNISIMFPTQAGVIYTLQNNFGFGLQAGYLNLLTDYLDNISEIGNKPGNDNIFILRLSLMVPIAYKDGNPLE
ncbi:MAG: hypothetical protein M3421_11305 [Bacteroidota bacterium]|nr:hypothetical protein [Bacteroidota bacterium]